MPRLSRKAAIRAKTDKIRFRAMAARAAGVEMELRAGEEEGGEGNGVGDSGGTDGAAGIWSTAYGVGQGGSRVGQGSSSELQNMDSKPFTTPSYYGAGISLPTPPASILSPSLPHSRFPLAGSLSTTGLGSAVEGYAAAYPTPSATPPSPSPSPRKKSPAKRARRIVQPTVLAPSVWTVHSRVFDEQVSFSRIIPAGTIFLPHHHSDDLSPTLATDGWTRLSPTLLHERPSETSSPSDDIVARAQTARLLVYILDMSSSLQLRATVKLLDQGALLRIYLVPIDLPELATPMLRDRRSVPSATQAMALGEIVCNRVEWADGTLDSNRKAHRLMDEKDQRSLLQVYRDLDSPSNDNGFIDKLEGVDEFTRARLSDALAMSPRGMITELYPYQRASVTKMLARELAPESVVHPAFQLYTSAIDESLQFYLSLTGECRLVPPRVLEPKGGILADLMGSGKTAISLSLILSTLGDLPQCSESTIGPDGTLITTDRLILTPLCTNFPFAPYRAEQAHFRPRVPLPIYGHAMSPAEEAAHQVLVNRQLDYDRSLQRPPLPSLRDILINFVRTTSQPRLSNEQDVRMGPLLQDLREAPPFYYRHPSQEKLESRSGRSNPPPSTRILVSSGTLVVVPAELLQQWQDECRKHVEAGILRILVLKSSAETMPQALEMMDYDIVLVSTRIFSDALHDGQLPLHQVHWRRLMIDEGHILGGDTRINDNSWGAERLLCESRWAITGTPSTHLRSQAIDGEQSWVAKKSKVKASSANDFENDFDRIGNIFANFLKHPAFRVRLDWKAIITTPMLSQGRGAARLARVLQGAVVRNQPSRVEESYVLPELQSSIKYFSLEPSERKMYNALISLFVVNSLLSQQTDQDYLFHKSNREYLNTLTLNLRASSFWFAPDPDSLAKWQVYVQEWIIQSGKNTDISDTERESLHEAIRVMQEALNDAGVRMATNSLSAGLEVEGLDGPLLKGFGAVVRSEAQVGEGAHIVPTSRLVELRNAVEHLRRPGSAAWKDDEDLTEEILTYDTQRHAIVEESIASPSKPSKRDLTLPLLPLPLDSSFFDVKLGRSTSAKLNYVVESVRHHPDEKFLVFSNTLPDLVFARLSESFDLYGISHAILINSAPIARGKTAASFNTSSVKECQVLLVNAKSGGRGLTLTSAANVIMLEPIWDPDLAVQAVKRAHRLGQTKPVKHVVLVIEESFEHKLLLRGQAMTPAEFDETKKPQDDAHLRNILQSANYLRPSPTSLSATAHHSTALFDRSLVPHYQGSKRRGSEKGSPAKKRIKTVLDVV